MPAARVGVICKTSQAVNQAAPAHDNSAQAQAVAVHDKRCENCARWTADGCCIPRFQRLIDFRENCQGWLGAESGPEHLHMQASNN